jgi:hypothetical protein
MSKFTDEIVTGQIMAQPLDSVTMTNNFNFRYESVTERCAVFRAFSPPFFLAQQFYYSAFHIQRRIDRTKVLFAY